MHIEQSEIVLEIQNLVTYWKINMTFIRHSTGFVAFSFGCNVNISVVSCISTINVLCEKEFVFLKIQLLNLIPD